ncbi:MAG: hypothetical protein L0332_11755 [Chloroflexi bacterium]|nr:hypothetical protein [Chloroflexota bacterium]MCI0580190.1 hypothetical protein [Chloroflexota bacterium]MCI0646042.1 hypothetical protein [Chloroflexota bacterium]MCI0727384.1 hypothetical protein [Chloroflexota bacterium]
MSDTQVFKQIIGYLDRFHRDVGQLVVLVEQLMEEEGFVSLPSAGNRASWNLSSHYARPDAWRIRHIARVYMEEKGDTFEYCLFYLILLETQSEFDFPVIICGRIHHPPLKENQIYNQVYLTEHLRSLAQNRPSWQSFRLENGWTVAEPTFKTPSTRIAFYILNLFDLNDRQRVVDNIIRPLTQGVNLDETLTVSKHLVPALREE